MKIQQLRALKDFNFDIIRGGTMFNESTSYDMKDMYFRHIKDRSMTYTELAKLDKKKHCELKGWMTPIEREEMLKECLVRLVESDDEREEHYLYEYGYGYADDLD